LEKRDSRAAVDVLQAVRTAHLLDEEPIALFVFARHYVQASVSARRFISVVPYQTADAKNDLKTSDVARNARTFALLISCTATEQSASAKKSGG
jgi:hypothetical protein